MAIIADLLSLEEFAIPNYQCDVDASMHITAHYKALHNLIIKAMT
jgi:hypothetical protein